MKKHLFFTAALIVAAASVAIVSCKKDNAPEKEKCATCNDELSDYLKSFKKELLSNEKNDKTFDIDDAEWHLNALLNFDFGDAHFDYRELNTDTLSAKISINNGQISFMELANAYNSIYSQVLSNYYAIQSTEKNVFSIECYLNETPNRNNEDEITVIMKTQGGLLPVPTLFDTTDNWLAANDSGKCDGTCQGMGAPQRMEQMLDWNKPIPSCGQGRITISDQNELTIYGINEYDPDYTYGGYLLFCEYCNPIYRCIPYDEMTFYYNNALSLVSERLPSGYSILDYDCSLEVVTSVDEGNRENHEYFMYIKVTIGKITCTSQPLPY
ncbi:MAG: hypothetical protein HUJ98_02945 [Bacteroidaceae bacterium]|nr:hypothetical protein [Bacteroidaceae bacterium]